MSSEYIKELLLSGNYDNVSIGAFAVIIRAKEAEFEAIKDEIEEEARLTAEDIAYEKASHREGTMI